MLLCSSSDDVSVLLRYARRFVLLAIPVCVVKNESNLTQSQKKKRDYISQLNLKTSRALRMRDAFQEIYKSETIDDFTHALNEWYSWIVRSQLELLKKLERTIKKHMHGILRWKLSQINNGILEAFNSVIQAAKRKAGENV